MLCAFTTAKIICETKQDKHKLQRSARLVVPKRITLLHLSLSLASHFHFSRSLSLSFLSSFLFCRIFVSCKFFSFFVVVVLLLFFIPFSRAWIWLLLLPFLLPASYSALLLPFYHRTTPPQANFHVSFSLFSFCWVFRFFVLIFQFFAFYSSCFTIFFLFLHRLSHRFCSVIFPRIEIEPSAGYLVFPFFRTDSNFKWYCGLTFFVAFPGWSFSLWIF